MIIRIIKEIKEDMKTHLNEFQENINKQLNDMRKKM
jgi:hypothetical protein